MNKDDLTKLFLSILLCESAGLVGSIFTIPAISTWYPTLNKPSLSPPNWVFGPVWLILYALMGVSLYLVWQSSKAKTNELLCKTHERALVIFIAQFILNVLWSIMFFGLKRPDIAFVEIIVLWLTIIATIFYFLKISKRASYLLIPYLFWVSFASYLNYSIWTLN